MWPLVGGIFLNSYNSNRFTCVLHQIVTYIHASHTHTHAHTRTHTLGMSDNRNFMSRYIYHQSIIIIIINVNHDIT